MLAINRIFTIQPCGRASGGHHVEQREEEGLQVHLATAR